MVNEIGALTSLVRQLAIGQHQTSIVAKVYGICTFVEYPTNMCPMLQETESNYPESIKAIGGNQYGKQPYQIWKAAILAKAEFRSICSSTIRTCLECTSRTSRLSTTDSTISGTTIPTTATSKNSSSRQFTISRGPDEAISNLQPGLANTLIQLQSARSSNLPSQTITNPRGNASAITSRSGKALPQLAPHQLPRSAGANSKSDANSQMPRQDKTIPLSFPTWTFSTRKPESDEELLKIMQSSSRNCVYTREEDERKCGNRRYSFTLTKNKDFTTGAQALPKKCQDPGIFSVPCTIGDCTFVDVMLDLRASINVMPTSIYKSLNFSDLEPTRMTIQLANRSVVQLLGVLEDVLVQVNELIFPTNFYVLDMEDETSGKGSTLILGQPFLMTSRTKIDVHVGMLSMEFGNTLVQFNIFEAMKHPTEDHLLFGVDLIDELVEEHFQLDSNNEEFSNLAEDTKSIDCLRSLTEESDYDEMWEVHIFSDSEDDNIDLADLSQEVELIKLLDQVCKYENPECSNKAEVQVVETKKPFTTQVATMFTSEYESNKGSRDQKRTKVISAKKTSFKANPNVHVQAETISAKEDQKQVRAEFISANQGKDHIPSGSDFSAKQGAEFDSNSTRVNFISVKRSRPQKPKAKIMSAHLVPNPTKVGQSDPKVSNENSSSLPPPMELKPLPNHLKYA
ncbi:hypothetical protein CR513_55888, partial [Mucuna pruriens]